MNTVSDRRRDAAGTNWVLVVVAGMLSFIAMLDMNIVNIALADIGNDLGISVRTAQWVVLGYQVPVVALLLPAGRWLDAVGTRPALLSSIIGFGGGSLLAASAMGPAWLIGARVVQGVFGAVLFVLMPVLAARAVPAPLRGRAMSVPATLGPLGAAVGPAVGGVLLDSFGWRAVFLVKIPICVLALILAARHAPRGARLTAPDRTMIVDAILIGSGVTLVLLGLTFGAGTPGWLALALSAALPLTLWARHSGRSVLAVPRESGTVGVNIAVLALAAGFAVMNYLVALRMQRVDHTSASVTGLTLLSFAVAMALAGPVGGRLADTVGVRRTAIAGAGLTAAGLLSLLLLGHSWAPSDVAWRLGIAGLGMGLYGGPTQLLAMMSAAPAKIATAGAAVQLARSLGFTLGPALATVAWTLGGRGTDATAGLWLASLAACSAVALLAITPSGHPASRAVHGL